MAEAVSAVTGSKFNVYVDEYYRKVGKYGKDGARGLERKIDGILDDLSDEQMKKIIDLMN